MLGRTTDFSIHFELAFDIAKALLGKEFDRDERKTLCQLFSKLHLPEEVDENKVRTLKLLIDTIRSVRHPSTARLVMLTAVMHSVDLSKIRRALPQ